MTICGQFCNAICQTNYVPSAFILSFDYLSLLRVSRVRCGVYY